MVGTYHLAQLNIGLALFPVDDPLFADFMDALDGINALAEASPGFVWRLQTAEGNATSIHAFDDPNLLMNMSVWENADVLFDFVYKTSHQGFMARPARVVPQGRWSLSGPLVDPGRHIADDRGRQGAPGDVTRTWANAGGVHLQAALSATR